MGNKKVVIVSNNHNACGEYRIFEPYSNIAEIDFHLWEFVYNKDVGTDEVGVIMFQRPSDAKILQFIKDFKAKGGIVVVETDDDMANIPASNPVHEFSKSPLAVAYSQCIKEANYVHVSTPELAIGNKSTIFLNAINLKKYIEPLEKKYGVMWAGSQTHYQSLQLVKPAIEQLLNNGIKVGVMSEKAWLEKIFKPHENLDILDIVPFEQYYKIPSMASVFITPLPYNKFSRCKSELKVIEAAAWGVPSVSSTIAPFIRFNKLSNGGNILVRKERTKEWLKAIYSLLEDKELYKSCSEKSRRAVETHYNLEVVNSQRVRWWKKVLKMNP